MTKKVPSDQDIFIDVAEQENESALDLQEVTDIARDMFAAQKKVDHLQKELDEAKKHLNQIANHDLPEAMGDLTSFELSGGYKVELKPWISARDSKEAQDWLAENGRGGVIKDVVTVTFDRGEHDDALGLLQELNEDGYAASEKMSVHYQTLCAEIRRMINEGVEFPRSVFQMEEGLRAKITAPK